MKHSPKNWAMVCAIQLGIIVGGFSLPNNVVNGATWYAPIVDFGRIALLFGFPVGDTILSLNLLAIGKRRKAYLRRFIDVIKGTINVQVIIVFEPTQESIGTVAKVLRVDEEHFKAQNLYASTQNAIIQVGAGLDPATFNSNLPDVAEKVKVALQREYGKMVHIQEVRITGIADFGKSFNDQLAQQSALKAATANEASKLKLIQAKKATLEAEAINIKAIDPIVRDYQLKVRRLEIEATLAEKGISPYATGVTLSPSSNK